MAAVQTHSITGAAGRSTDVECQIDDPLILVAQARSRRLADRLVKYHWSVKFMATDTPFTA